MAERHQDEPGLGDRVRASIDRAIQRNIKGLRYITAPKIEVGLTPKDTLIERGTLRLYHYRPLADEVYRVPVLMVMATSNRGYLFDLAPGQSMVEYLLKEGFDLYLLDWEAPEDDERHLDLETYTQDFIPECVDAVLADSGEPDLSIAGYCMGGVLSLIYAATHSDGPLKNLACFTTPVNWHEFGLTRKWQDPRWFDVDCLVDALGVIPSDVVTQGFEMLRPAQKAAGRIRAFEQMWNDQYVEAYRRFDRWGAETLPLAGEYYRDTVKELMWGNKLYTGELVQRGKVANLANITCPVFHATAAHDHIVPEAASAPLLDLVGSEDKTAVKLKGGHVSLVAGPNAARRMWPALNEWLAERSV